MERYHIEHIIATWRRMLPALLISGVVVIN